MPAVRFGRARRAAVVEMLPVERITPNPHQPRRFFAPDALASLSDSIRRYGILQPLTVRRAGGGYELIAGERRLRAARLIGLTEVPCIIVEVNERESAALAIIENLQREDLSIFEQAEAIRSLISTCALTQEEVAARLSVSQSFVANKLRLLRFLPEERQLIIEAPLTERHARTLLRLPADDRLSAIREVIRRRWNVAETESYVDRLLSPPPSAEITTHRNPLRGDARLFANSLNRALDILRSAGVPATSRRRDTDSAIEFVVTIPVSRETSPIPSESVEEV